MNIPRRRGPGRFGGGCADFLEARDRVFGGKNRESQFTKSRRPGESTIAETKRTSRAESPGGTEGLL